MDMQTLLSLEKVNQLRLEDTEREDMLAFFTKQDEQTAALDAIDTENTERMVHVMPIMTVVREDVAKKLFTRDDLQKGAPETMDGYWQVPRVVE